MTEREEIDLLRREVADLRDRLSRLEADTLRFSKLATHVPQPSPSIIPCGMPFSGTAEPLPKVYPPMCISAMPPPPGTTWLGSTNNHADVFAKN